MSATQNHQAHAEVQGQIESALGLAPGALLRCHTAELSGQIAQNEQAQAEGQRRVESALGLAPGTLKGCHIAELSGQTTIESRAAHRPVSQQQVELEARRQMEEWKEEMRTEIASRPTRRRAFEQQLGLAPGRLDS